MVAPGASRSVGSPATQKSRPVARSSASSKLRPPAALHRTAPGDSGWTQDSPPGEEGPEGVAGMPDEAGRRRRRGLVPALGGDDGVPRWALAIAAGGPLRQEPEGPLAGEPRPGPAVAFATPPGASVPGLPIRVAGVAAPGLSARKVTA